MTFVLLIFVGAQFFVDTPVTQFNSPANYEMQSLEANPNQ